MFWKLCKLELKYSWRSFLLMYVVLILCSLLINVSTVGNSDFMNFIQGILIIIFSGTIFAISILVIVNVVRNFAKSMFGRESYLTHTLPVSSTQLLVSKTAAAIFWSFVSGFVIMCSVLIFALRIVGSLPSFDDWVYLFQHMEIFNLEFFASLCYLLLAYMQVILQIFFVMTLVHTAYIHKHRVAFGVIIYLLINFVQSFIVDFISSLVTNDYAYNLTYFSSSFTINGSSTNIWLSLAISLILCCLYFFGTRYLLDRKLEVE